MLTVIRAMADAVAERRSQWLRERLDPAATDAEQNALLAEMLATALFAGEEAVRHTPEQLDVLAEAGVVDAGALGLVVIIRGIVAGLAGEQVQLPEIPHYAAARLDQVHHADSAYRYCTNFIVTGEGLAGDSFVGALEGLGDSVLVVGDAATLKVHVHTDDPDAARAAFDGAGRDQPRRHRRHARAGRRAAGAARPGACRGGRGRQRRGDEGDVRGARRALRRRRPDPEPADQGHPRRDRVVRRRRGPGAPQLAQRDHGGRGGGAARGEGRPHGDRRAVRVPAGGARGDGRVRPRRERGGERRAPRGRARGNSGRRGRARPRATTPTAASGAATRSASRATRSSPGAAPDRRSSRPSPRSPTAPRSSP